MEPDQVSPTVTLLEARLRRVEHLLYGGSTDAASDSLSLSLPAAEALVELERRFSLLVSNIRVYAELLRIYHAFPSLFQAPPPSLPPTQLDADAVRAIVLSYASAFPATASALSAAVSDMPVPDAALSAQLAGLVPRMQAAAAAQQAMETEAAQLRGRSERLVRRYYEKQALAASAFVADVETRVERAEGRVRRLEKEQAAEADEA